jgi:hypothetical protein
MDTLQDVIDMARYRMNNYVKPYLFLDAEMVLYANEARNIICRDGKILEDSRTVSVCQFSTVADQFEYTLNPIIIYIRSLKLRTQETLLLDVAPASAWSAGDTLTGALSGATCVVVTQVSTTSYTVKQRTKAFTLGEIISNGTITADQGATYPQFVDASSSTRFLEKKTMQQMNCHAGWRMSNHAQPIKYVPDYNSGYLTLYPKPDDIYVAEMSVIRYPLTQFTPTTMSTQSLEINPQWANAIVEGICYQAYQKRGEETYDPNKVQAHFTQFRKLIDKMQMTQALFESNAATAGPNPGFI